mmetsp:Transcript_61005/g.178422  ORF Transcript_61005/g.178422 Transcript_61005/m.178422 type:complete len:277 (+) Transcript_61005:1891-2721(+)
MLEQARAVGEEVRLVLQLRSVPRAEAHEDGVCGRAYDGLRRADGLRQVALQHGQGLVRGAHKQPLLGWEALGDVVDNEDAGVELADHELLRLLFQGSGQQVLQLHPLPPAVEAHVVQRDVRRDHASKARVVPAERHRSRPRGAHAAVRKRVDLRPRASGGHGCCAARLPLRLLRDLRLHSVIRPCRGRVWEALHSGLLTHACGLVGLVEVHGGPLPRSAALCVHGEEDRHVPVLLGLVYVHASKLLCVKAHKQAVGVRASPLGGSVGPEVHNDALL